jgi:hypothetical protein
MPIPRHDSFSATKADQINFLRSVVTGVFYAETYNILKRRSSSRDSSVISAIMRRKEIMDRRVKSIFHCYLVISVKAQFSKPDHCCQ